MRRGDLLRHYLYGLLVGGADVVPGVSGGTVAFVLGIYGRVLESISRLATAVIMLLRRRPDAALAGARSVDWAMVLPLAVGIVTAFGVGAAIIPGLMEDHPVLTRATFLGLIMASIVLPWQRIRAHTVRTVAIIVVAAVAAFLFTGLGGTRVADPSYPAIFLTGAVAICAMVLPGVSGAFLLVLLGMYEPSLEALRDADIAYLVSFGLGAVVGLGVFAVTLRWLLARAHDATMAALVGLMLGSLRALWPYLEDDRALRLPAEGEPVLLAAVCALIGVAIVLVLTRVGEGVRPDTET